MTAAQKKARENFTKAIAYRKKTGCTLKQAFAYVKGASVKGLDKVVKKGNKTAVIYSKKAAPKIKAAPKKKVVKQGSLFGVNSNIKKSIDAYKKLELQIKDAEKEYKNSINYFDRFYAKQTLDKLKIELRDWKFIISNLQKDIKKII
jgi:hypothetical protein